ncbi:hypothetical protein ACEPAF_2489 [Sanghuangporus sanghuang]
MQRARNIIVGGDVTIDLDEGSNPTPTATPAVKGREIIVDGDVTVDIGIATPPLVGIELGSQATSTAKRDTVADGDVFIDVSIGLFKATPTV